MGSTVISFRESCSQCSYHLGLSSSILCPASPPSSNPPEGSVHSNSKRDVCRVLSLKFAHLSLSQWEDFHSSPWTRLSFSSLYHDSPLLEMLGVIILPWKCFRFHRSVALQSGCLVKIHPLLCAHWSWASVFPAVEWEECSLPVVEIVYYPPPDRCSPCHNQAGYHQWAFSCPGKTFLKILSIEWCHRTGPASGMWVKILCDSYQSG